MPANDSFTTLNVYSGGDSMDESGITYGGAPTTRKRARVVVTGDDAAASIAVVMNTAPVGTEYGVGARIIPSDVTVASTALGALNAAISVAMAGQYGASFQLAAGTLVGTIVAEISFDGGTTWVGTFFDDPVTSNKAASIVFGSSNTLTIRSVVGAGGASHVRVRVSAYTSGTANAVMRASQVTDPSCLYGGQPGTATPPVGVLSGGSDGSLLRAMLVDTSGRQINRIADSSGNNMPSMDVAARKGFQAVTDGTNTAAVKAASTAAAAADPALVVAISPNNTIPTTVSDATTGSTALGALNAVISIALAGHNGASFLLSAGTLIGTIVPEISFDGGTNWQSTYFDDPATSTKAASIVFGSSNGLTARSVILAAGCSHARIRVSAYTSGTANAVMRASMALDPSVLFAEPDGTAGRPPTTVAMGGYDGANLRTALTDVSGRQVTALKAATGTASSVSATITASTTILASNANRLGACIYNECTTGSPILYLALAATCTTSSYTVQVPANGYYELPYGYTGIVTGTWSTVTGATAARVSELTN